MTKQEEKIEHKQFLAAMRACGDIKPAAKRRAGEGITHFTIKAIVFWILTETGHQVTTEAKTPDGRVYDVLDFDTQINYEIQDDIRVDKANLNASKYIKDVVVIPVGEFRSLSPPQIALKLEGYLVI
jgi:hypothetical protein